MYRWYLSTRILKHNMGNQKVCVQRFVWQIRFLGCCMTVKIPWNDARRIVAYCRFGPCLLSAQSRERACHDCFLPKCFTSCGILQRSVAASRQLATSVSSSLFGQCHKSLWPDRLREHFGKPTVSWAQFQEWHAEILVRELSNVFWTLWPHFLH